MNTQEQEARALEAVVHEIMEALDPSWSRARPSEQRYCCASASGTRWNGTAGTSGATSVTLFFEISAHESPESATGEESGRSSSIMANQAEDADACLLVEAAAADAAENHER